MSYPIAPSRGSNVQAREPLHQRCYTGDGASYDGVVSDDTKAFIVDLSTDHPVDVISGRSDVTSDRVVIILDKLGLPHLRRCPCCKSVFKTKSRGSHQKCRSCAGEPPIYSLWYTDHVDLIYPHQIKWMSYRFDHQMPGAFPVEDNSLPPEEWYPVD